MWHWVLDPEGVMVGGTINLCECLAPNQVLESGSVDLHYYHHLCTNIRLWELCLWTQVSEWSNFILRKPVISPTDRAAAWSLGQCRFGITAWVSDITAGHEDSPSTRRGPSCSFGFGSAGRIFLVDNSCQPHSRSTVISFGVKELKSDNSQSNFEKNC